MGSQMTVIPWEKKVVINGTEVLFRELTRKEELLEYFRLRYQEWEAEGYDVARNSDGLDIEPFDLYARFVGAFVPDEAGERLVGGVRMVEELAEGPTAHVIREICQDSRELKRLPCTLRPYPFQVMEAVDLSWLLQECRQQGKRVADFSRTVVLPTFRRGGVGIEMVKEILKLGARLGVDVGIGMCPEKLQSFYESSGCEVIGRFFHPRHRSPGVILKINLRDYLRDEQEDEKRLAVVR